LSDYCPHCDARLPLAHDAFCPECRERLDDLPETSAESGNAKEVPIFVTEFDRAAALMTLVGFGLMILGIMAWGTEGGVGLVVKGGLGLLLFAIGMARLVWSEEPVESKADSEPE
jgi:hypothetical protein